MVHPSNNASKQKPNYARADESLKADPEANLFMSI